MQNLDEYITEFLLENKISYTLKNEKVLKSGFTEFLSHKGRRKKSTSRHDQTSTSHCIAFCKTFLLLGRAFNSLVYERPLDILSTLIENSARVRETLKDQILESNGIDILIFWDFILEHVWG